MKVIFSKDILNSSRKFTNSVVAIGVFDGVHFGHRKIISSVVKKAKLIGVNSVVVTFWPHPHKERVIYSLEHRIKVIEELGVDICIVVEFSKYFSEILPEDFIKDFLLDKIGVKYLYVGDNFHFGKKASGNVVVLRDLAKKYKFKLKIFRVVLKRKKIVSSTSIRKLIDSGDFKNAKLLLMRPVSVMGDVIKGTGIASQLGFPTANINPHHEVVPPSGIYICNVFYEGRQYKGICYIGAKPTFIQGSKESNIEVNIFDFKRNIYGKVLEVQFIKKIRNEKKFSSQELLKKQIEEDIFCAKKFFLNSKN